MPLNLGLCLGAPIWNAILNFRRPEVRRLGMISQPLKSLKRPQRVLLEKIQNAKEPNDAKPDFHSIEEEEVKSGPAPEETIDSIATALQEAITYEVKWKVGKAMPAVPNILEEGVEQLLRAATLSARRGIRTVAYHALKQVILTRFRELCLMRCFMST